jgi:hypothetical protein
MKRPIVIEACDLYCKTYPLAKNEMFWVLEPTVMEIPLTEAPLGKDTFWIGATTGCGWHWLFTKATKYKKPRNSGHRPSGGPIAILDVEVYDVREDQRATNCRCREQQCGTVASCNSL